MTQSRQEFGGQPAPGSLFDSLRLQPSDPLLGVMKALRDDPRPTKVDLGVGVYRTAKGDTPVFSAVKAAEALLLSRQTSKGYIGAEGDLEYVRLLTSLIGEGRSWNFELLGVQTPGGTGALRLAADVANRARPGVSIWIGEPSWPIHHNIFAAAGLNIKTYSYFDTATQRVRGADLMDALGRAEAGDVVLLHGCCHNPTGADLTADEWRAVADCVAKHGLTPLIDLAYHGLGDGLVEDTMGASMVLEAAEAAFIAYSCDKNFGLYRERTGLLLTKCSRNGDVVHSNTLAAAKGMWSMPPDHGAAVVRIILESSDLTAQWRSELDGMRQRLNGIRSALATADPRLAALGLQRGLFSTLSLTPTQVDYLRREAGIYMVSSGRINVAGLNEQSIPYFVTHLNDCFSL